ncbi:MAG: GNAT family N-acetyltransferase [Acidobacteriota bacterium]
MTVTMQQQSLRTLREFDEAPEPRIINELRTGDENEILEFLSTRPIHTVVMAGLICDNGLVSPHNRGSFYACRDQQGNLEGVALVGHATLIEAITLTSLSMFARLARNCRSTHLIRGERETIDLFWKDYAGFGQEPRTGSRELLLAQHASLPSLEPVDDLRLATLDDLDLVVKVNAGMVFQESGLNPLNHDPSGFRHRTARRIEQGRVWVWVQEGRLIFKTDILAETRDAVYLEGVQVHPEERLKGYGSRCLAQLGATLLAHSTSICLTVNEENKKALDFYSKAGYEFHSSYETIYLANNS